MSATRRPLLHRRLLGVCLALMVTVGTLIIPGTSAQAQTATFTNPLNSSGSDPWMTYYDGNYYLMTTTWTGPLTMRRASTIAGLKNTAPVPVFNDFPAHRDHYVWAPEFHFLDGPNGPRWYIYYSAGAAVMEDQRVHVAESAGTDPMGPYTYKGMVFGANNWWGIDGSVVTIGGRLYLLWSGVPGRWTGNDPSIYIVELSSPWTVTGPRTMISAPEHDWEVRGTPMNEGPAALQRDGRTFVTYSASNCNTPDYKLGLLELTGSNPLDAAAWKKHPEPVFERNDAAGVYGPAHNGFFKSPDGTEDWIVYHANDSASDGCGNSRNTRIQKFSWNADGTPNFGRPVSTRTVLEVPSEDGQQDTVRYEAEDAPATCDGTIASNHAGYSGTGFCDTPNTTGTAAQFTVTAESAREATVRIRFANGSTGGARGANVVVNGSTVASASFEVTGSWSAWKSKTLTVPLNAGNNTIRLVATGSGGLPNVDYLDLVVPDPGGGGEPVRYEAESAPAVCDGTIASNHAGYSGTGFCDTPNTTGASCQFTVTVNSAGQATVAIRFANGSTGGARGANVVVNGATVASASFEVTGSWSTWATKTVTVPLNAGNNTIRLVATGSGGLPNIDYLEA